MEEFRMFDRLKSILKWAWCLVSFTSLLLPYALSSQAGTPEMYNLMTATLATLFVLSAPFSLFTIPLFALFKVVLALEPNTMFGAYFYVVLINVIGYVQWF